MKPILQHRWKLTGKILQYYGLRCAPKTMQRQVRVSRRTTEIIKCREVFTIPSLFSLNYMAYAKHNLASEKESLF